MNPRPPECKSGALPTELRPHLTAMMSSRFVWCNLGKNASQSRGFFYFLYFSCLQALFRCPNLGYTLPIRFSFERKNVTFTASIITVCPEMFPGVLGHSLAGKALERGDWELKLWNLRDFATDKHKMVDDTPYGGGAGMVMKPDVVHAAIEAAHTATPHAQLIYMTPRGEPLTQARVEQLAQLPALTIVCGRFETIDERVITHHQPLEISIGDYILFGGEVAAQVLLEATLRCIDGVVGNRSTHDEESFAFGEEKALLLEYPHYTRPPLWKGYDVPDVLLSGHHEKINLWRKQEAERVTRERRPDLWEQYLANRTLQG